MADFTSVDLSSVYGSSAMANKDVKIQKKGSNLDLDMTDFIQLMITQLTNQGIDETVDTSDMLNQMIQMQMVETIATLTDASVMTYAASLVGQYVTVGKYDSSGNLQEYYGQVTGTGTMNGNQVVFIDNNEYYQMSEIMAVGKLPAKKEEETEDTEETGNTGGTGSTTGTGSTGSTGGTLGLDETDETEDIENTERPDETPDTQETGNTTGDTEDTQTVEAAQGTTGAASNPEYRGENGTPDDREA